MRIITLFFGAVVILMTACISERTDRADRLSPPSQAPTVDRGTTERVQIYAAVIRRLITRDHTFGRGPSPFNWVWVVNGAIRGAGDPRGDLFGPAPDPFPAVVVNGIKQHLQDLPPLRFIIDGNRARLGKRGISGVKNDGVIVSLGPIERHNGRVTVSNGLWCGGTCGQWLTYVLRQIEGGWEITGTTGPYAIS